MPNDLNGFIVGSPSKKFTDYDGQFAHSQPDIVKPYSENFTAYDDFKTSFFAATSIDDASNLLFNNTDYIEDPTYDPFNDPRLKERPDYLKIIYQSNSQIETEDLIQKYEEELDQARLIGSSNLAGTLGTILGFTLGDPVFYTTISIGSAVKGANFMTRFGKASSYGIAASMPFEYARTVGSENFTGNHFLGTLAVIGGVSGIFSGLRRTPVSSNKSKFLGEENANPSAGSAYNPHYNHGNVYKNGKDGRQNFAKELEEEGAVEALGLEKLGWNPVIRLLNSTNVASRRLVNQITSIGGIIQKKNLRGAASSHSVEVEFRTTYLSNLVKLMNKVHDEYITYAGGVAKGDIVSNMVPLAQAWIKRHKGAQDIMSHSNFRQEITKAMRNGDVHPNPYIQNAAKEYRKFYNQMAKEAQEVELFTRNLKINLNRLKGKDSKKQTKKDLAEIARLQKEIQRIEKHGPFTNKSKFYVPRIHNQELMLKEQSQWIRAVTDYYIGQGIKPAQALKQATDDFDAALRIRPYQEIDDTLDALKEAGSAHQRTLDIPDEVIARWLENDIELLTRHYNKQMGMDILFTKKFGDITMKEQLNEVKAFHKTALDKLNKNYKNGEITKLTYDKNIKKLNQQLKNDLRDIRGIRDRTRGTYGAPKDPHRLTSRAIRGLKSFSVITLMGGAAISSIPDIGIMIMHHGFKDSFQAMRGLWGMNSEIIRKMNRSELHNSGEALEMALNSRSLALADVGDIFGNRFAFEKSLHNSTNVFMFMNGLNMWNTIMKETTGLMVSNKISSIAKKYVKTGKLSQLDKQRLANVGIDPDMLKRIGNNVNKHGENKNGFLLPNTDKWNDPRAVTHFRVALTEDVSRTIVTPGSGDRALLTSTEWGSMIAQYKSFSQSFTQRVLTRGLQEKDSAFVIGVGAMISLGMLVEQIKRKQYGQKALTNFDSLLYAGIERSGVMGWFMDINNIAEKVTDYNIGLRPALGVATPNYSTLASKIGAIGGPSATQIINALTVGKSALTGDYNYNTRRALRTLTPGNTLPYADPLMDAMYNQDFVRNTYRP